MNNKNNQNPKSNENDIITKKGFLISFPGKKQQGDSESSINFAKPKADNQNSGEKNSFDKKDGDRKNNKKRFDKKRGNFKNKQPESAPQNDTKHDNHKNEAKNNQPSKNEVRDNHERNNKNNRHGKPNKNNKFDKNDQRAERRDNRQNVQEQNNSNKQDNAANNKRNKHDNKQVKQKMAPLSALSSDIASYAKMKSDLEERTQTSELSLEEKYKNAKPLSEQIAEQEMRQKGIKIPYDNEEPKEQEKQEIVGVRFREAGKVYYFDPDGKQVPFGTPVIVETARGSEYGFVAISNRLIPVASLTAPLKKIERIATTSDTQKHVYNKDMEKDAEVIFKEKVEKLGLPMNLIYVEYTFDNSRLLFYFTAETRIDFRELVKELAGVFRTRIELRQIGVRDEAKTIGGLGVCGRATCCNTFLGDFAQVSIKMAKDQNLSLNAAKISGACGKLMCCLRYEDKVYEEENARTPKVGSVVETLEGKGVVTEARALKGIVIVALENSPETPPKPFHRDEVTVVGFNKNMAKNGEEDESELKALEDHQ